MMKISLIGMAAALTVLSSGCGRDSVKVYHVEGNDTATPTPQSATATMPLTMPPGLPAPDNSGLPPLKYTLPDGWQEKPASQMRVASFGVSENGKTADVSVIPLGGMAGNDPANVNRWRGQIGLGPLNDDEVLKLAEKVTVGAEPADLYDLLGNNPEKSTAERIVAVIFHRDGTAWFFKMTGDAELVEKQKPAFVSLLKSIQFGAGGEPAGMDLSQLPTSHPSIMGTSLGSQNSLVPNSNTLAMAGTVADGKPVWTIPAGWQDAPLTQFLLAKYTVAGTGDTKADINISSLAGDGGGMLANVNRWRGQLGLPPLEQGDLDKQISAFDATGSQASLVDFTGTNARTGKPTRLVGVVLPSGGQTWFYKLMGDENVVSQQKEAFIKFIQSAKYPDAH